jgi:hypothetical protein
LIYGPAAGIIVSPANWEIAMFKLMLYLFAAAVALVVVQPVRAASSPFDCRLREAHAYLYDLQTYSGFRWIECIVGVAEAEIEGVSINDGNCQAFEWPTGRIFYLGETFNVPYACMSPVRIAITANGVTSKSRLR